MCVVCMDVWMDVWMYGWMYGCMSVCRLLKVTQKTRVVWHTSSANELT